MRRNTRYLILLLVLLFVAINEANVRFRSTSWDIPLTVRIYAYNADGRPATEKYIKAFNRQSFGPIESFVNLEAKRYGVRIEAIEVEYLGRLQSPPPMPPSGRNIFENIVWSLKFRAWAWRRGWSSEVDGDVELFVNYFDPQTSQSLRHSVGLQGGMIGIINAFASRQYRGSNQVVITHELMHTLGADDKYAQGNAPLHPEGYAEPWRKPLYPQRKAEIMGGRIPLAEDRQVTPESLKQTVIGRFTAAEINWPITD